MNWKRKFPNSNLRFNSITTMSTRKNDNTIEPKTKVNDHQEKQNASVKKIAFAVFIGLIGFAADSIAFYEFGYKNGYQDAESNYPSKVVQLQDSQEELTEKNAELLAENKSMNNTLINYENKIDELQKSLEEQPTSQTATNTSITNKDSSLDSQSVRQDQTTFFFDEEIYISLREIEVVTGKSNYPITFSVGGKGYENALFSNKEVGDKVVFLGKFRYEIIVNSVSYTTNEATFQVTRLP
jgi:hypothetical protein